MSDKLVLVTGASGYIACHVIQQLQQAGYQVRGTVRSLKSDRVSPLKALYPGAKYELQLVEADLTSDDGWDKAMDSCYAVIHTASPFPNLVTTKVEEANVVGPAKLGTIRVLKAAAEAGVKKVVLTSSFVAVLAEAEGEPGHKYNEADWAKPDSSTIDAYSKSKVLAEKAAWELLKELPEEKRFTLSVINPVFVMGPPLLESHKSSTSVQTIANILNHKNPAIPKVSFALCDVRDVAKAHLEALTNPEANGNRHIISTQTISLKEISEIIAQEFRPQGYKICTLTAPYVAVWAMSLFDQNIRNNVLPRVGVSYEADNTRMTSVLGIPPTPIDKTLCDMAYALIDLGIVAKSKKYCTVGSRAPTDSGHAPEHDGSDTGATLPAVTDLEEGQTEVKEGAI